MGSLLSISLITNQVVHLVVCIWPFEFLCVQFFGPVLPLCCQSPARSLVGLLHTFWR